MDIIAGSDAVDISGIKDIEQQDRILPAMRNISEKDQFITIRDS